MKAKDCNNQDSKVDIYNKQGKLVYQAATNIREVRDLGNRFLLVKNRNTGEYEFMQPKE